MNDSFREQQEGRASLYGMLALGFTYPDTTLYEFWNNGSFVRELSVAIGKAAPEIMEAFEMTLAPELKMTVNYEEFEAL